MDAIACIVTFISSLLLGMEFGIIIGVAISLASLLYSSLRPKIDFSLLTTRSSEPGVDDNFPYLLITPARSSPAMTFPCVDHISSSIQKLAVKHSKKSVKVLVLDCSSWQSLDYTAATSLVSVIKGLRKNGQTLLLLNMNQSCVDVLVFAGLCSDSSLVHGNSNMEGKVIRICSEESSVLKEVLQGNKQGGSSNELRDRSSSSVKSSSGASSDGNTTSTEILFTNDLACGSVKKQLVK